MINYIFFFQSFFASEMKNFDSTLPSWSDFVTNAKSVFEIFKENSVIITDDVQVKQPPMPDSVRMDSTEKRKSIGSNNNNNNSAKNASSSVSYFGSKYLTSSQLFGLQLTDPFLRMQVAVQMLIFIHYLKVKALPTISNVEIRVGYLKDIVLIHDEAKKMIDVSNYYIFLLIFLTHIFIENSSSLCKGFSRNNSTIIRS
jgi:hypothetical protein